MSFTSLLYLYGFFPLAFLGYIPLSRSRFQNLYLLVVSLLFYAWGSWQSLFILVFLLTWNYVCALQMGSEPDETRRKRHLILAVAVDLLVLIAYKYINPGLLDLNRLFHTTFKPIGWVVPTGLSFYLFSCLSCLFDVYRQKEVPLKNPVDFGVFAAFFGWVNMGPIAHYSQVLPQLHSHSITREKLSSGALLLMQGLVMKVLLADNFASVFAALGQNTSWLGNLLLGFSYFFQLYFDFAGYSRMARGTASLFGFVIPRNFDKPYTALSVSDFWRRWHISLTSWFRQYIYIPLGGNRVAKSRWIVNILAVWLLTGIWHGGSFHFVLWGLYQAAWLLGERLLFANALEKAPRWLRHGYVILTQLIGWTLFFAGTSLEAFAVIGRYFFIGVSAFADMQALFVLRESLVLFAAGILGSTLFPLRLHQIFQRSLKTTYPIVQTVMYVAALAVCTAFLISATNQTFLYAAF